MEREDNAIADAVSQLFPAQAQRLRSVLSQLDKLPGSRAIPTELAKLNDAFEQCVRSCRQTKPTVMLVKKHLEPLQDGVKLLNLFDAELTDEAVRAVRDAATVRDHHVAQLRAVGGARGRGGAGRPADRAQLALIARGARSVRSRPTWESVRAACVAERARLLRWQEQLVEQARGRVKARDGFGTLTADQVQQGAPPANGRGDEYDGGGRRPAVDFAEGTVRSCA